MKPLSIMFFLLCSVLGLTDDKKVPSSEPNLVAFYGGSTGHLYDNCKSVEQLTSDGRILSDFASDYSYCLGFVSATASMENYWVAWDEGKPHDPRLKHGCIPESVEAKQLIRVFNKYAAEHPERLNDTATHGLLAAIQKAFPCR